MGQLFGTDGVRGLANDKLTPELAFKLGRAAAAFFAKEGGRPLFIIGKDTRQSGDMLETAIASGICSAGGDALCVGVIPTPGVAFLARDMGADAGVVISASHNPFADNGIKFFSGDGFKLPDETEDKIEQMVLATEDNLPRPTGAAIGRVTYDASLVDNYLEFLWESVDTDFRKIKVVVDCANGAASELAPRILRRLGANVFPIFDEPNGHNINVKCGSTHPQVLQKTVTEVGAHLGIAHDGDADRLIVVDEKGNLVDGDQIMAICGLDMLKQGKLKDNTLVATVMSNLGLHIAFKKAGGQVLTTQVGDRYVLEKMLQGDYNLGGEQSGHIIFRDFATTGDGLVSALQLISILKVSGKKLSELASAMHKLPQILINVRVKVDPDWAKNRRVAEAIAEAERELGEEGRVLVRPSGTEPLIRIMAEGPHEEDLGRLVNHIASVIEEEFGGR